MPLVEATLASGLKTPPTASESAAAASIAGAYATYAAGATALSPILPGAVSLGLAAMTAELSGMSADSAGLTKLPAAVRAFWTAAFAIPASAFAGAASITPFTFATLDADFKDACDANTAGGKSLSDSMDAIAAALHKGAVGGMVTMLPPPPGVTSPIT